MFGPLAAALSTFLVYSVGFLSSITLPNGQQHWQVLLSPQLSLHPKPPIFVDGTSGHASYTKQAITPELSMYVETIMRENGVPGLALGVFQNSGESEFAAWGNRTEDGEALATDTLMYIGSCSKAFLAASMGILMDDFAHGRNTTLLPESVVLFDWDTKVKDLLPGEWNLMDQWAEEKANIRDILSHVSGVPRHDAAYSPSDTAAIAISRLQYLRPAFELRAQWSYNNIMYIVAQHIITKYSGMNYTAFVEKRIFAPLNMTSTTYSSKTAHASGRFTQTWSSFGRRIPQWFDTVNEELLAGAGGIITTVEDLEAWTRTLMNSGIDPRTNQSIIPRSAFEEATTAHNILDGKPGASGLSIMGYGMAWGRMSYQGHDIVLHSGGLPGATALVSFMPSEGIAVVALINADDKYHSVSTPLLYKIIDGLFAINGSTATGRIDPEAQPKALSSEVLGTESPPLALESYAGTYNNSGYNTFTICAPSSTSQYCADVLSAFAAVDAHALTSNHSTPSIDKPQLFAAYPSAWAPYIRFIHISGQRFTWDLTALFVEGYGADKTPFEVVAQDGTEIEFVVDGESGDVRGFGLVGTVVEKNTDRQRKGGGIQEIADAWFDKM
ncbi:beta-lactamase/transpeptidase-like protein [Stereum hirsutum FP-91666 SS1]|uniref:beta-lactamase/transpeptidase-like protein n=1 Tax=Stereum hirsutum (strain FP-91666) TaxID=721885 RepID=UPI000444948E|nr:beta-lactamase/transpeptidase-like protein [Stereum hirsutum FP-91666 SS1]EIM80585.1 beta-lactamase/transpeptidase-like protein [Stereum hirsutum FP-91666 SS1]